MSLPRLSAYTTVEAEDGGFTVALWRQQNDAGEWIYQIYVNDQVRGFHKVGFGHTSQDEALAAYQKEVQYQAELSGLA